MTASATTEPTKPELSHRCATCGTPVDPLRAERVAFVRERFRYFCSGGCRERFDEHAGVTPLPVPQRLYTPRPEVRRESEPSPPPPPAPLATAALEVAKVAREEHAGETIARRTRGTPRPNPALKEQVDAALAPPPVVVTVPEGPQGASGLLLLLAALGALLALGLGVAGSAPAVLTARVVLCAVATLAFVTEGATSGRDRAEIHPLALAASPIAAAGIAWGTFLLGDARASEAATLTSVILLGATLGTYLLRRARRPIDSERDALLAAVDGPCRRVVGEEVAAGRSADLRPGEEILVEAGDVVPADATVTAGTGVVHPWFGAKVSRPAQEGDTLLAGATVMEGRLRAVVGWADVDRAFIRLTHDERRRADLFSALARFGKTFTERAAPFISGFAALAAFAAGQDGVEILLSAVAVHAACAQPATASVAALWVARAVLLSLRRGVVFRTAEALDRAGRVSTAVFCARGTLLLGEPEVASIEGFAKSTPEEVLSLVAGAENSEQHPTASAVLRAARGRGIRPDAVRSQTVLPGLGVTAIASNGQPLVVGSRALMLREHVSVAAAERRVTELEGMGQSVLLVARAGRLLGLVGLQDGLRPGARSAVQHLLDSGIEPVLMSGDARETCEALGRALAIDHIRPELPPAERGDEVRRLSDGGAITAVIGQSPADDAALAAAEVSVALGTAGSSSAEWSVQLATDDARDATHALSIARDCLRGVRVDLAIILTPTLGLAAMTALGLAPSILPPLAAAAAAAIALKRPTPQG
jgi:P-type E1-E2 ATPase